MWPGMVASCCQMFSGEENIISFLKKWVADVGRFVAIDRSFLADYR